MSEPRPQVVYPTNVPVHEEPENPCKVCGGTVWTDNYNYLELVRNGSTFGFIHLEHLDEKMPEWE